MNIDKNKILKMLVTLTAICLLVGSLTMLLGGNSMTLSEYAAQQGIDTKEQTAQNDSLDAKEEASESDSLASEDSAAQSSLDETTENLQTEAEDTAASQLTGASLNGDSMLAKRVTYTDGFYYEPLSDHLRRYITGVSYPAVPENTEDSQELAITYDDLRYLHILHYDFEGNPAEGELICNQAIAQDLVEIFYELYRNEYQLEKVRLIDEYDGDDTASMEDNNTSCFNYRVVEGTTSLSKHALGLAIDINPFYNPYVTYESDGSQKVSPAAALDYADRSAHFPYTIDESDLCYKLFTEHGFTWGGNWNSSKDYQHFQKTLDT